MSEFKVVSARKQDRMRPDGGLTTVYEVWLETAKGASGRVEVPADVWDGDGLKAYLEEQAANLDKAFNLFG